MSGKNTIALHFGTYLEGTENQFLYYNASSGLTTNFTLPEGVYFFTHRDPTQQINAVLTALLAGSFPLFACTQPSDRTLAWTMDAAGDYIRLVPTTSNDDDVKLARLLGLYTAAGDMTYYQTNIIPASSFTTLSSFFSESGLLYETYDLSGFPVWNSEYSLTESGNVNVVNSSRKQEIQLQLTCLAGFDFRGIADYPAVHMTPGAIPSGAPMTRATRRLTSMSAHRQT